jgi:hypothetical protein
MELKAHTLAAGAKSFRAIWASVKKRPAAVMSGYDRMTYAT